MAVRCVQSISGIGNLYSDENLFKYFSMVCVRACVRACMCVLCAQACWSLVEVGWGKQRREGKGSTEKKIMTLTCKRILV